MSMSIRKSILIIPGGGIGAEVAPWGRKVLEAVAEREGHAFSFEEIDWGGGAPGATGKPWPLPEKVLECDAILAGTGDVPVQEGLRQALGLFAGLHPLRPFEALAGASVLREELIRGTDLLLFRELPGSGQAEGLARRACAAAAARRRKLCVVEAVPGSLSGALETLAGEYAGLETTPLCPEQAAALLLSEPGRFDVVLAERSCGDMLTGLVSAVAGSGGLQASACLGSEKGIFAPVHGDVQRIAGRGVANPLGAMLSAALMLEIAFGLKSSAERVVQAIGAVLRQGYRTLDMADKHTANSFILGTEAMGQQVLQLMK